MVGITLDDDVADTHPVTGAHIGAVDVHGLHHVELAEARDLGDALGELLTGQGGGEAVAVLGRCDGAARGDEKDALHAGIPIVLPPQGRSRSAVLWHRASNVQTYYIICDV